MAKQGYEALVEDEQGGEPGQYGSAPSSSAPGQASDEALVEEVVGQVSTTTEASDSAEAHAEVGADATESGEEFAEASAEELAASAGEETAITDLRGVEGYEEATGEESAGGEAVRLLAEAGTATEGGEEFFPFLISLASKIIPTLVSTVGPSIAQAVSGRLSPRAKKVLAKPRTGTDVIAVLQRLLAQAMKQGGETAAEAVDEAAVEEVVEAIEVIIGTDDRVRITNTTKVPWRRYCALRIEFRTGAVYRGTGFFIGPRTVATAGHCVYLHNQGGWARRIEVIPGCNGTSRPFGSAWSTAFRSTAGWINDKRPETDYGALFLAANAFPGQQLGSFGFGVFPTNVLLATPVVLAGYPGDKPFAQLWGMSRRIKAATATQLIYDIDTVGGQSGAPVYMKRNGKRYVVGIHNYGASTGNSATRVTQPVAANFRRWRMVGAPILPSAPTPAPAAAPVSGLSGDEV